MPRYGPSERLVRLVYELQSSRTGLSVEAMCQLFTPPVARRTVERLRDAVDRVYPLEVARTEGNVKYWRTVRGVGAIGRVPLAARELAALETAARHLDDERRADLADALRSAAAKLRGAGDPARAAALETDTEALMEAEGIARRPGPRLRPKTEVLAALRDAILACRKVRLTYTRRSDRAVVRPKVYPYGVLTGSRHYLVCWSRPAGRMMLYALPEISAVEVLDESFERDPDFDLARFAERSFGVFQEEPVDVIWRFSPRAAADARQYLFHPTQKLDDLADGSLLVRFRAGGLLEMAWHLFTWGQEVEVLAPARLRQLLGDLLAAAARSHARSGRAPLRRAKREVRPRRPPARRSDRS